MHSAPKIKEDYSFILFIIFFYFIFLFKFKSRPDSFKSSNLGQLPPVLALAGLEFYVCHFSGNGAHSLLFSSVLPHDVHFANVSAGIGILSRVSCCPYGVR